MSLLRTEAPDGGAGSEKVGLALAGRTTACAGVADEDGGAVAGLEERRPVVEAHGGMAGGLAQALCRLPAELVAEACDPARLNPVAARRLVSGLGFDQFDPGGDVDAIGAAVGGDPLVTLSVSLTIYNNYAWRYSLGKPRGRPRRPHGSHSIDRVGTRKSDNVWAWSRKALA